MITYRNLEPIARELLSILNSYKTWKSINIEAREKLIIRASNFNQYTIQDGEFEYLAPALFYLIKDSYNNKVNIAQIDKQIELVNILLELTKLTFKN